MDLFQTDAPWQESAGLIQVFKLYGEWVAYHATDLELQAAVAAIRRRGLALAVEAGPLDPPSECGQGVEGFAGTDEARLIARRIRAAGGTIDLVALDEPFFFAHVYDGPNACHWPADRIAEGVTAFIRTMRSFFPEVIVGDTEPLAGAAGPADYTAWLETFRSVAGYDLAFLHMDIDWGRPEWPEEVLEIEHFGRDFGVPVGIIYNGNYQDTSDEDWISIAGQRVIRYELEAGGRPEHVLFQSWHDSPDHALPETEPYTFTGFIVRYFGDRATLGFRAQGRGANLAFGMATRVSRRFEDYGGEYAVDRDSGTLWNSGDFAPQWIEIDLGSPHDIQGIQLVISQSPAGETEHRVLGRGPGAADALVLLHTFAGPTADSQTLSFAPDVPWSNVQSIRVQTVRSPSWVAWREIRILDAGED
jgi:hypothetical protein